MLGTKERGLADVAKADEALASKSYQPKKVRLGPDELNLVALAAMYLQENGVSRSDALRQAKIAIARGGLNAPFTVGGPS